MKKRIISLLLSTLFVLSSTIMVVADANHVWSNASDWAVSELEKAQDKKLIPTILNGADFKGQVTREEFAAISVKVYEALSAKVAVAASVNPFTDTTNPEILKAYNLGITTGVTATTFAPNNNLTREQAATMLSRAYMKAFSLEKLPAVTNSTVFADDASISDWAKESVYYMASNGIINGVSADKFAPKYTNDAEKASGYGCATREQALLIAVRICDKFGKAETKPEETTKPQEQTKPEETTKPEKVEVEEEEFVSTKKPSEFVIGFIGGSLTEGGSEWIAAVKEVYEKKYPDKVIKTINAGIGGTGSSMGASRYKKDILAYEPDVVYVEFAVNDRWSETKEDAAWAMESIIRQSLKAKTVPNMVILYTPIAMDKTADQYKRWEKVVGWHQEVADHYGVPTINIYDYMYNNFKKSTNYKDYLSYLKQWYTTPYDEGYDVHGGYSQYAAAIVEKLEGDFKEYNVKPKNASLYINEQADNKYKWTWANSDKITYTKNWTLYTSAPVTVGDKQDIGAKYFDGLYFPNGIQQTVTNGEKFVYNTTPGIEQIYLSHISSNKGATATVKLDGKEIGTWTCNSEYHGMNYTTSKFDVPNDGKSHKLMVTVDGIDKENTVFRFGAIVEIYR